ncbi:hypothetical protein Ddye_025692 [Dipteronia dyeriana]|uniref:Uncharacterized protein n=1 Tax=Dipteronia dyeriana TaxID=168575 RepID=A0AAD9TKQ6_9ROSI|nr:hypothetical protein Ddye_025692 [Dipteronia dyeriana]
MMKRLMELLKTLEEEWYKVKVIRHNKFGTIGRIEDVFNRVPEEFVVEDRHRLMASCFGHFMTMHRPMKFSGGVIYQLLLWELHHNGPEDEMRFMLGTHKVRFSKVELRLIIGLRFRVVPDTA